MSILMSYGVIYAPSVSLVPTRRFQVHSEYEFGVAVWSTGPYSALCTVPALTCSYSSTACQTLHGLTPPVLCTILVSQNVMLIRLAIPIFVLYSTMGTISMTISNNVLQ